MWLAWTADIESDTVDVKDWSRGVMFTERWQLCVGCWMDGWQRVMSLSFTAWSSTNLQEFPIDPNNRPPYLWGGEIMCRGGAVWYELLCCLSCCRTFLRALCCIYYMSVSNKAWRPHLSSTYLCSTGYTTKSNSSVIWKPQGTRRSICKVALSTSSAVFKKKKSIIPNVDLD